MGIATGMKQLTRDISSSRRERGKRLHELGKETNAVRGETRDMLRGFEESRREANGQLRQGLARDKARRQSEASDILQEARNILKGLETSRKAGNVQLKADLARGTAEIRAGANEIVTHARQLVNGFALSRQGTKAGLKKGLAGSRAEIKAGVKKTLGDFSKSRVNVRTDLKEARAAWQGLTSRAKKAETPPDTESGGKQVTAAERLASPRARNGASKASK